MFLPCPDPDPHKFADADPDPGKKVRKWMNKSLFCRVGDVQCKQFHFICSDFKPSTFHCVWTAWVFGGDLYFFNDGKKLDEQSTYTVWL